MNRSSRPAGRRLIVIAALAAILTMGIVSSASAVMQNNPVWQSGGTKLTFGKAYSTSGNSISGLNLKWISAGHEFWAQCQSLSAKGTLENPAAGKAGTLASSSGTFEKCELVFGAEIECEIPSQLPVTFENTALTNETYSQGGLVLKGTLAPFKTSGCKGGTFPYEWKISFTAKGYESGNLGEQFFPQSTNAVTVNLGSSATMEFGMRLVNGGNVATVTQEEVEVAPYGRNWYVGGAGRPGEGARTLIAAGSPFAIAGGSAGLTMESVISGVTLNVGCAAGSPSGSVENPKSGEGTASIALSLSSCAVAQPAGKGCVVETGAINTGSLAGTVAGGSPPLLQLAPTGGSPIATFKVSGCAGSKALTALNGSYELKGNLLVYPQMFAGAKKGSWSIPSSKNGTGSGITLRGQAATVSGEVVAESSGGEVVTMG